MVEFPGSGSRLGGCAILLLYNNDNIAYSAQHAAHPLQLTLRNRAHKRMTRLKPPLRVRASAADIAIQNALASERSRQHNLPKRHRVDCDEPITPTQSSSMSVADSIASVTSLTGKTTFSMRSSAFLNTSSIQGVLRVARLYSNLIKVCC